MHHGHRETLTPSAFIPAIHLSLLMLSSQDPSTARGERTGLVSEWNSCREIKRGRPAIAWEVHPGTPASP
ncbi:hypothetical protein EMIT0196P_190030 [Pseudomonas chlororaphis]